MFMFTVKSLPISWCWLKRFCSCCIFQALFYSCIGILSLVESNTLWNLCKCYVIKLCKGYAKALCFFYAKAIFWHIKESLIIIAVVLAATWRNITMVFYNCVYSIRKTSISSVLCCTSVEQFPALWTPLFPDAFDGWNIQVAETVNFTRRTRWSMCIFEAFHCTSTCVLW